jgi:hypothetical protein
MPGRYNQWRVHVDLENTDMRNEAIVVDDKAGPVCCLGQGDLCAERSAEPCMCPCIKSMLTAAFPQHATNMKLQVLGDRLA